MSRRDRDVIRSGATTPSQQTTNRSNSTVVDCGLRVQSSRGKGSKSHLRLLSLVEMHPEDDSPEQLTLKISGAYVWESLRAPGDSILKDTHKMSCTPSPSAEEAV